MKQILLFCLFIPLLAQAQPPAAVFNATKKIMAETPAITSLAGGTSKKLPLYTYCTINNDSWVRFYQVMPDSTVQEKNVRLYDLLPTDISSVQEAASSTQTYYRFSIGKDTELYGKDRQALETLRQAFHDLVALAVNEFPAQLSSEKKDAILAILGLLNTHYQECYQSFDWYFRKFESSGRKKTNFFSRWVIKGDSIVFNAFSGYLSEAYKCEIYAYTLPIHYAHFSGLVQDGAKSYIKLSGYYKPTSGYVYSQGNGNCSMKQWTEKGVQTAALYLAQNKVKSNYMLWADMQYDANAQQKMNTFFTSLRNE